MPLAALQVWLRVQSVAWTAWLVATAWFGAGTPPWWGNVLLGALLASGSGLAAILRVGRRAADHVTAARFVVLLVAVWLAFAGSADAVWIATAAVVLDLVDGAVARRFGGSPQGAVFDMEVDQLTVLALAALVVARGGGVHVLLLPALRYLFVLGMWWADAPAHEPKPKHGDNRRGRRVCAAVMTVLLLSLWPPLSPSLRDVLTAAAVVLLAWSFADDARFLLAHRRGAKVGA